jgi:hypothetical protein
MFKVGDKVWWTSQENGPTKEHHGTVVQVVEIRRRPDRNRFSSLYKDNSEYRFDRDHESYVVRVGTKNYWPIVEHLRSGVV